MSDDSAHYIKALTGDLNKQPDDYAQSFKRFVILPCPSYPTKPDSKGIVYPTMLDSPLNSNILAKPQAITGQPDVGFHPVGMVSTKRTDGDAPKGTNYHVGNCMDGTFTGWKAKVLRDHINKIGTEFVFDKFGYLFAINTNSETRDFAEVKVKIGGKTQTKKVLFMWGPDIYGPGNQNDAPRSQDTYTASMLGYRTIVDEATSQPIEFNNAYEVVDKSYMNADDYVQAVGTMCGMTSGKSPELNCGKGFIDNNNQDNSVVIKTGDYVIPKPAADTFASSSIQARSKQRVAWPKPAPIGGKTMNPILSEFLAFILYREDALLNPRTGKYYYKRNDSNTVDDTDYITLSGTDGVYSEDDVVPYRYYVLLNPIHGSAFSAYYQKQYSTAGNTVPVTSIPESVQEYIQNYCQALAPPDMNSGFLENGSGYNPDPTCACLMQVPKPLQDPSQIEPTPTLHGAGAIKFSNNSYPNLILGQQVIPDSGPLNQYRYFTRLGDIEWNGATVQKNVDEQNHNAPICQSHLCYYQNSNMGTTPDGGSGNAIWPASSFVGTWAGHNESSSTTEKLAIILPPLTTVIWT